jgi:thiosulfate dehydrogenase [quinone] large subunit
MGFGGNFARGGRIVPIGVRNSPDFRSAAGISFPMPTTTGPTVIHDSAKNLGYATLRLAIGMSMLIHGAGRFPKISAFAGHMVKDFARSPLPAWAVDAFARITPFAEFAIGVSILLGLATRWGLTLGGLWMVLLIFGSALIEKYDIVGIQLVYSLIFFHLLMHLEHNSFSLDALISRSRTGGHTSKMFLE